MGSTTFSDLGALGLYTETPLHCGAEAGTGYVDLPIQRERHTGYPVIPGSTLKGVLRDELKEPLGGEAIVRIFGKDDATSPGKVSFGDGVVVAFPVRSSEAPFHWVTCPFVLERVFRALGAEVEVPRPAAGTARAASDGEVLLEELRLERVADPGFFAAGEASGAGRLADLLPKGRPGFDYTRQLFRANLLVINDDDFALLVTTATEVVTRIKLNGLGTTTNLKDGEHPEIEGEARKGNLFVEELVPPETLFLAALRAASGPGAELAGALPGRPVVRLGGDETIGRGVTHLTYVPREV